MLQLTMLIFKTGFQACCKHLMIRLLLGNDFKTTYYNHLQMVSTIIAIAIVYQNFNVRSTRYTCCN
jgi:hypothetical protein